MDNDTEVGRPALADEEIFIDDVSDEMLEAAAGAKWRTDFQTLESSAANCCHGGR